MSVLCIDGLNKRFGGILALDDMSFSLEPGEVHCLLGANGCGKSTLCKCISGVVQPDSGRIAIDDTTYARLDPGQAKGLGVSVVYQELSLTPRLTVAENLLLGIEPKRFGFVDRRAADRLALAALQPFMEVMPLSGGYLRRAAASLPPDERQLVEIAKVLARNGRILIFDEPTASLHKTQVDIFFALIKRLKAQGKAIIFISHRMEEIARIGDRATIMRNGRLVKTVKVGDTRPEEIIDLVTGGQVEAAAGRSCAVNTGETVLETRDLSTHSLDRVSLALRRCEILGLGGLQGQGQADLLAALFGFAKTTGGSMLKNGLPFAPASPAAAQRRSLAYISGDRKVAGVFLIRPIFDNLAINHLVKNRVGWFRRRKLLERILPFVRKVGLKFQTLDDPVNSLSGGTQQKVVIGRWLMTDPDVLLLDDPTKGIDVQTKAEFYRILRELCAEGTAVVWNSSDDAELLANAGRILVFSEGRVVDELAGERLNEFELYKSALDSGAVRRTSSRHTSGRSA